MNYFLEITKKVQDYCNTSPVPDSCGEYLDTASKVRELSLNATCLAQEGVAHNDERIIKIYEELSKILEG